jgi:hypothetical protein
VHRDLTFAPAIERNSGTKHPEYMWATDGGPLWCECKEAQVLQAKMSRRVARVSQAMDELVDAVSLPAGLRVDVILAAPIRNRSEERISMALGRAAERARSGQYGATEIEGEASVAIRPRQVPFDQVSGALRSYSVEVGTEAVRLDDGSSAKFSLAVDLGSEYARKARELIKNARTQLPLGEPSMVFLAGIRGERANEAAREVVSNPSCPVVSVLFWEADEPAIFIWRNGQPFDDHLLPPTRSNRT